MKHNRERRTPPSHQPQSRLADVRQKLRIAIEAGFSDVIAQKSKFTAKKLTDIANAAVSPKGAALNRLEGAIESSLALEEA